MIFNLKNYPHRNIWYVFWLIIVPVESLLGVGGNFLSLLVARKQAKTNGAYELQVYVMLSDLLYPLFALLINYSIIPFVLCGEGPHWLLRNSFPISQIHIPTHRYMHGCEHVPNSQCYL